MEDGGEIASPEQPASAPVEAGQLGEGEGDEGEGEGAVKGMDVPLGVICWIMGPSICPMGVARISLGRSRIC